MAHEILSKNSAEPSGRLLKTKPNFRPKTGGSNLTTQSFHRQKMLPAPSTTMKDRSSNSLLITFFTIIGPKTFRKKHSAYRPEPL
jgi:hypothetical protein